MSGKNQDKEILALVSKVVASYISKNPIDASHIPDFIEQVYRSFIALEAGNSQILQGRPEPFVSIESSIQPDYIICLEDGRRLKMLKRHLRTAYNMTPEQYRQRWGLNSDYPMVAPNYTLQRSFLAKDIKLGKNRGQS